MYVWDSYSRIRGLSYKLRRKIEFVIAGGPNPRLISSTFLDEAGPYIPFYIIMKGVIVRIGKITNI